MCPRPERLTAAHPSGYKIYDLGVQSVLDGETQSERPSIKDKQGCCWNVADALDEVKAPAKESPDSQPAEARAPPAAQDQPAIASQADDLEALRSAVVDAAGISAGLWLSYLFVLFYLLIAAGGVTHRDLFFANPVKLPFLNVDLPLRGFFSLGPGLFLIVHAYVLLHFDLFARKIGTFDIQLRAQVADPDLRSRLRRQLPINIFVQFLAGPPEVRRGPVGLLLKLIARISLVLGPVALLVFFQLQFLPYHDEWITWWQRLAVVLDLVLLWVLWPEIERSESGRPSWWRLGWLRTSMLACATAVALPLVFVIATFPGELLDGALPSLSLRRQLVAGGVNPVRRMPTSLWSNRLVLPGFDVIDHTRFDSEAKVVATPETASLRARHLEGAILAGAVLRKVDLTGAYLQGANLIQAELQGANLEGAQLQGATLAEAQLQGTSLIEAHLQGATLSQAQLQGANLYKAELGGAILFEAHLQGADLIDAHLQGAMLSRARLQGANLDRAQLLGALLDAAHLESASLRDVSAGMDAISKALTQGARFAAARPAPDVYERGLAEQWRVIGCAPEGAPYVLGKLVEALDTGNSPFARDSPQVPPLASAFLKDDCAGGHGVSEATRAHLMALRDRAAQPAAPGAP